MPLLPVVDPSVLRAAADVLADTDSGLTNREIDDLLRNAGIYDPTPRPSDPNLFVRISKRDRLFKPSRLGSFATARPTPSFTLSSAP